MLKQMEPTPIAAAVHAHPAMGPRRRAAIQPSREEYSGAEFVEHAGQLREAHEQSERIEIAVEHGTLPRATPR